VARDRLGRERDDLRRHDLVLQREEQLARERRGAPGRGGSGRRPRLLRRRTRARTPNRSRRTRP
jgi:hypothetical protein